MEELRTRGRTAAHHPARRRHAPQARGLPPPPAGGPPVAGRGLSTSVSRLPGEGSTRVGGPTRSGGRVEESADGPRVLGVRRAACRRDAGRCPGVPAPPLLFKPDVPGRRQRLKLRQQVPGSHVEKGTQPAERDSRIRVKTDQNGHDPEPGHSMNDRVDVDRHRPGWLFNRHHHPLPAHHITGDAIDDEARRGLDPACRPEPGVRPAPRGHRTPLVGGGLTRPAEKSTV